MIGNSICELVQCDVDISSHSTCVGRKMKYRPVINKLLVVTSNQASKNNVRRENELAHG